MAEIVFTRIDDRLLHGQVSRSWVKEEGANLIVVANDAIASDRQTQKLMNIATPLYADTIFLTIKETIKDMNEKYEDKKALILVENPEDALRLVEAGLDIRLVNVGNMRNLPGKEEITENIYLGSEDKENFKKLHDKGVELDIRTLSTDAALDEDILL